MARFLASGLAVPPAGKNHGSAGICLTPEGCVVVVREDGASWGLPGGRPEPGESRRQTLEREVGEEACCYVEEAILLGYVRAECLAGHEAGLVIVRANWRAAVSVQAWAPQYEMVERLLLPPRDALERLDLRPGNEELYRRAFFEALSA